MKLIEKVNSQYEKSSSPFTNPWLWHIRAISLENVNSKPWNLGWTKVDFVNVD